MNQGNDITIYHMVVVVIWSSHVSFAGRQIATLRGMGRWWYGLRKRAAWAQKKCVRFTGQGVKYFMKFSHFRVKTFVILFIIVEQPGNLCTSVLHIMYGYYGTYVCKIKLRFLRKSAERSWIVWISSKDERDFVPSLLLASAFFTKRLRETSQGQLNNCSS